LTVYLWVVIVFAVPMALATPWSIPRLRQTYPQYPVALLWALPVVYIGYVVFAIALLRSHRWGFWGLLLLETYGVFVSVFVIGRPPAVLTSLLAFAVLIAVGMLAGGSWVPTDRSAG